MDTSIFRYVLEVEKYRNITQAAKRLFISQPALTKQLNKLEKELGFSPFDRTHSPISVTPQGEIFLDFARRYVQLESEMMDSLRQFNQIPAEPVLIATTHRGGAYAAVQAAPFMMTHPEIHLSYLNRNSQQCEEELESESIDLAIYTEPVHSENIEYMPVQEDPLVFVIPQESPILEDLDISDNSLEHPVEIDFNQKRTDQSCLKNLFSENITSHRFIRSALIMLTHDISLPAAAVASPCCRTRRFVIHLLVKTRSMAR